MGLNLMWFRATTGEISIVISDKDRHSLETGFKE